MKLDTDLTRIKIVEQFKNQAAFARHIGMQDAQLSSALTGRFNPTAATVRRLANGLNCPYTDLLIDTQVNELETEAIVAEREAYIAVMYGIIEVVEDKLDKFRLGDIDSTEIIKVLSELKSHVERPFSPQTAADLPDQSPQPKIAGKTNDPWNGKAQVV